MVRESIFEDTWNAIRVGILDLIKPVKEKKASNAVVALKNFDPFFSIYDYQKIQAMRAEAQKPLEKIETSKDGSIIDELTLKGIMFIGGKKVALLNDRIVQRLAGRQVAIEIYQHESLKEIQEYLLAGAVDHRPVENLLRDLGRVPHHVSHDFHKVVDLTAKPFGRKLPTVSVADLQCLQHVQ